MQNNENSIDKLFRNKLLNNEVVPPPGVWDNIVMGMDAKSRKKRLIWMLGFSSAASLLLAFLAGWYFAVKQPSEQILQAEVLQIETVSPAYKILKGTQVQTSVQEINPRAIIHSNQTVEIKQLAENIKPNEISILAPENSQRENIFIRLLSPVQTLFLKAVESPSNLIAMNSDGFSDSDRAIIAMNAEVQKESSKSKKLSTWAVGVQASPVYRFEQNSVSQDSDPLFSLGAADGTSNYVTNISGGIQVELNTSSRLSVQSGVNYGEVAQNSGDVGLSFAGHNWVNDRAEIDENKGFTSNPNSVNSLSNNMILKTQMGLANIEMPDGANLALVNVENSFSPEVARNYGLEQRAGYLEIPLVVRYKIIDRRIDFLLLGGINTNVLMSNNVTLADSKAVIANGKIEGLNPLTFSSSVGMGVNYAITNRFRLSVEPTMKIQLNSLNQQASYDSRPYTVGIFTGISYQF